jgi:hypothetical protein
MTALQWYDHAEFHARAAGWIVICILIGFAIGCISDETEAP